MSRNAIYNTISLIFFTLTVLAVVGVALLMASPPPEDPNAVAELPTPISLPSLTPVPPTETPRPTLPPTFTPTPTNTVTATRTLTPTPSQTPSATITETPGPTNTPSVTPTIETAQAVPGGGEQPQQPGNTPAVPAEPSPLPFYFDLRDQVLFSTNTFNSAGCNWQGVVGSVLDQTGIETARQFQIRVFNQNFEQVVQAGSNTQFGQVSGYEVPVSNSLTTQSFFVRLETQIGTPVSPAIEVTFPGDCNTNVARVDFIQIRQFGTPTAPQS